MGLKVGSGRVRAGFGQIAATLRPFPFQGGMVKLLDLPPAVRVHDAQFDSPYDNLILNPQWRLRSSSQSACRGAK